MVPFVAEIDTEALGWLPHTTRAAISGLRKAGHAIETIKGAKGVGTRYRIAADAKAKRAGTTQAPSNGGSGKSGRVPRATLRLNTHAKPTAPGAR